MKAMILTLLGLALSVHAISQSRPATDVDKRAIERRAAEAVVWGMPAVNFDRMLQAAITNGAKP